VETSQFADVVVETREAQPIEVRLEPWGEVYSLSAGSRMRATFEGPESGSVEIIDTSRGIELWGWSKTTARIWLDDVELGIEHRQGIPRTRFP
jgi:hypothetical protein